jgi:hypothetical protein
MLKRIEWWFRKRLISLRAARLNRAIEKARSEEEAVEAETEEDVEALSEEEVADEASETEETIEEETIPDEASVETVEEVMEEPDAEAAEETTTKRRVVDWLLVFLCIIVSFALILAAIAMIMQKTQDTGAPPVPTVTTAPTATPPSHSTWKMVEGDYLENRWLSEGATAIRDAKTNAEAASAAYAWLERVKTDPNLLVGAVRYFLNRTVDKATLVDADGWATDLAVQLVAEMQLLLSQAKITPAKAPSNGTNSGVVNGNVVPSDEDTITGDLRAIQIEIGGKTIWILARCGNIVTPKSDDPADYKQPGDGTETDSGTGTKPPVPTVSVTAEATPPVVITVAPTGGAIVAPGATPLPTQVPGVSPTPTPAPEPGVNPTSGPNTGDPGNPFK